MWIPEANCLPLLFVCSQFLTDCSSYSAMVSWARFCSQACLYRSNVLPATENESLRIPAMNPLCSSSALLSASSWKKTKQKSHLERKILPGMQRLTSHKSSQKNEKTDKTTRISLANWDNFRLLAVPRASRRAACVTTVRRELYGTHGRVSHSGDETSAAAGDTTKSSRALARVSSPSPTPTL